MITADTGTFLERLGALPPVQARALPRGVMMVMPNDFHVETESASDNVYVDTLAEADPERAARQAQALADLIEAAGVPVRRFAGRPDEPDGVFSNNAFASVPGRLVVGAMYHPSRQREGQRNDIRTWFTGERACDLADLEGEGRVAELTGPLVIDRARNVGYCGMSQRVNEAGLAAMHAALALDLTLRLDLVPEEYHTNVVLAVLAGRACVGWPGAFPDPAVWTALERAYAGRCLALSEAEKAAFAANCIALTDRDLFMSARAEAALEPASRRSLEQWGFRIHSTDLSELELAGGSLRCLVTEIF